MKYRMLWIFILEITNNLYNRKLEKNDNVEFT